jgi:ABC-type antimicrobial peptide transport system permease subunit
VSIAGVYATMTQHISRRRREIGIRMAVGATPNMVRALVFKDVCWILLIGLGVGIPAALAGVTRHAHCCRVRRPTPRRFSS